MRLFIMLFARVYYVFFCFERSVFGYYSAIDQYSLFVLESATELCEKRLKKGEKVSWKDIENAVEKNLKKEKKYIPDLTFGFVSSRASAFLPLVPGGFICLLLSVFYCFFLRNQIGHEMAVKTILIMSLILGFLFTIFCVSKKKMMCFFVEFELRSSYRVFWHCCSLFVFLMSFLCALYGLCLLTSYKNEI